jgi:hypothetical protein
MLVTFKELRPGVVFHFMRGFVKYRMLEDSRYINIKSGRVYRTARLGSYVQIDVPIRPFSALKMGQKFMIIDRWSKKGVLHKKVANNRSILYLENREFNKFILPTEETAHWVMIRRKRHRT